MALGEEVGDAYIEVHADSRPFRRELKRDARRAGREAGSEVGKGFNEGVDSELDDTFSRVGQRIRASLTRSGFRAGQGFGENMELGVKNALKKWNLNLADALIKGDFSKVVGEFDDLDTAMQRVDNRLRSLRLGGRLTADEFKDAQSSLRAWGDAVRASRVAEEIDRAAVAAGKLNDEMNRKDATENQRDLLKTIRDLGKSLDDSEKSFDESHRAALLRGRQLVANAEAQVKANDDLIRTNEIMAAAHRRVTEDMISDRREYFDQEIDGWLRSRRAAIAFEKGTRQGMDALRKHFQANPVAGEDAVDVAGWERALLRVETGTNTIVRRMTSNANTGMLGSLRGARNNFLNLVGILGGSIERIVGRGLDRVFDGVGGGVQRLGDKLMELGGGSGPLAMVGNGMSNLGDKMMGLGKGGVDGLVVQLVILAATLQGVIIFIGPLVAGLSGLLGIATALAVTVGGALLGALGSLLPILSALGLLAGAAVVGFFGMTDAMKAMLKPLETWFDRVKKVVADNLFGNLQNQVGRLVGFLDSALTPALEIGATALREFADDFLDMLNSPGVQGSMKTFRDHLPGILQGLGRTFNGTFAGITGIIAAAAPTVELFLRKIGDVAEAFGEWANSEEGRQKIADFFEKAAPAAETLFDIIGELAGIFGKLWEEGSDTGQTLLDNFSEALSIFNEWLGTKEGREELSGWFQYAEELAGKLGDILETLGRLWDELDTPENREIFLVLLDGLNGLIGALEWMAETGNGIIDGIGVAFDNLVIAGAGFSTWLDELLNFDWSAIWSTITSPFTSAWEWIVEWFNTTKENVTTWFHELFNIDWAAVGQTLLTGITTAFGMLVGGIFMGILAVGTALLGLPVQIATALAPMGATILSAFQTAWNNAIIFVTGVVTRIVGFVANLPSRIGGALSSLGSTISSRFAMAWNAGYAVVSGAVTRVVNFVAGLPAKIGAALSALGNVIRGAFTRAWNAAYSAVTGAVARVLGFIRGVPGKISAALAALPGLLRGVFTRAWNAAITAVTSAVSRLLGIMRGIPSRAASAMGNIFATFSRKGREIIDGIVSGVIGAAGRIGSALSSIISNIRLPSIQAPKINMPSMPKINFPWNARGSIVNGAQVVGVGEAGPEAIVPLNRPLSQVDPAVRSLSAYAQGKNTVNSGGSGNTTNDIKIFTPYSDPALVALEVVDALTGRAQ